jgi:protocatechuate 3,4-dioxygenase alpha subunit
MPVTASQTIGPFWHLLGESGNDDLTRFGATGPRIEIVGRVLDGDGAPVSDACVEIWQATPPAAPDFVGWGRCATDAHGGFRFVTLAPDPAAPVLAVAVFARGLLKPLWTRVYLAEPGAEIDDALLAALSPERRATLRAHLEDGRWRWDIRLQGDGETVFLDL